MKVIVDNIATEYEKSGTGKTVLLLHGWMDNLHTFDALVSSLGDKYQIVRLDMPGFGQTEMPKEVWSVSDYVEFVNHFLDKVKAKPDVIVGHSFGGRVSIKGLATGDLNIKQLILIGSAGIAKTKTLRNILVTTSAKLFGLVTYIPPLLFYRDKIRKKLYIAIGSDYLGAGNLKETYLRTIREDLQSYASKLKVPTLLVWGENDTQTPVSDGEKLHELIKNSRLEVLQDADHFVHQQKAVEVADLMKDFIG